MWANLQPDVRLLPTGTDKGKSLSVEEERTLLRACAESRSLAVLPAVVVALNTGMRYREILDLQWRDIELSSARLTVRFSKTAAGTGRVVPLNPHALAVLNFLSGRFPNQKPEHYVFASERYGVSGDKADAHAYASDPTKPIKSLKEAWERAKNRLSAIYTSGILSIVKPTEVRILRKQLGLTQAQLSDALGVRANTIARWERGELRIGEPAARLLKVLASSPEARHSLVGELTGAAK